VSADKRQPKMGRPPLPEGEVRSVVFTLRLSDVERNEVVRAAGAAGKHPTAWARETLLGAAQLVNAISARTSETAKR
jgi:hypothetical protein